MGYKYLSDFNFWCQKVLPLVYDDSLSYYEVLCKISEYINGIINNLDDINNRVITNTNDIKLIEKMLEEINKEIDDIKDGKATSLYIDAIKKFIDDNLIELVGRIAKYVCFGLSNDGYFIALIPTNWDFITLDTIIDPSSELYGHLVINW